MATQSATLCELCQVEVSHNFHHFIPRTLHSNKWFKKRHTRKEMQQGIQVCIECHTAIHELIPDEKRLGRHHSTLETLVAHPEVAKFVAWKQRRSKRVV